MDPKPARLVTCEVCGREFTPETPEEESKAWFEKTFGIPYDRSKVMEACPACFYSMIAFSQTVSTRIQ